MIERVRKLQAIDVAPVVVFAGWAYIIIALVMTACQ